MKTSVIIALCLFAVFSMAADLELTIDGEANAEIVIPPDAPGSVKFAAEELRTTVADISGAELPIRDVPATDGVNILLGRKLAEGKFDDDITFLKGTEGFAVRSDGSDIHIFGAEPVGTRNGVYSFLERNTDIIWARPADFGTIFTQTPTIHAVETDFREKPVYLLRGWQIVCVGKGKETTHDWLTRNRCNWSNYGPSESFGGGHNLKNILKKHMLDGDEFVGMRNGERLVKGSPQPCFSNRGMWQAFTEEFLKSVESHPDYDQFNINIEDTNRCCECPRCEEALTLPDGSIVKPGDPDFRSTQFFLFLNHVARELKKRHPRKVINTYAYVFTAIPPRVKLEDNIRVRYAPITRDYKGAILDDSNATLRRNVDKWTDICDLTLREYYGWSQFPRPISYIVARDLRYLSERGVREVYSELVPDLDKHPWNTKSWVLSQVFDANALEFWMISNLYWNPFQDVDALRKKFIDRAYRKAAPAMAKYYDILRESWYSDQNKCNYYGYAVDLMNRYVLDKNKEKECRAALIEAAEKAKHPNVKELIRRTRSLFEETVKKAKEKRAPEIEVPYMEDDVERPLDFDSDFWRKSAVVPGLKIMGTRCEHKPKTVVRLAWNKDNLFVGFDCEGTTSPIPLQETKTEKEPWTWGDHVEIFIGDGGKSYYQLNVDGAGVKYDAHGFDKSWDGNWTVETQRHPDGWRAVVTIPFATLGLDPEKNDAVKALFHRQCRQSEANPGGSWGGGQVHRPKTFGKLLLLTSEG